MTTIVIDLLQYCENKFQLLISVIIPTYNEQEMIVRLLNAVSNEIGGELEVIVVDGGSRDKTIELVHKFKKVKLVNSEKGRALQFNNGAKESKGNILFFIHADSQLPHHWKEQIHQTFKNREWLAGTFYLKFDKEGLMYRLYSRLSKIRSSLCTYGDQGLFVKKVVFDALGGYSALPIMEDYDIIKRLKKHGKMIKLDTPITTSSRRFSKNGVVFQQLKNVLTVLFYKANVNPYQLAKWYNK